VDLHPLRHILLLMLINRLISGGARRGLLSPDINLEIRRSEAMRLFAFFFV